MFSYLYDVCLGYLSQWGSWNTGKDVTFSACYKNKCISILLVYDVCKLIAHLVYPGGQ